MAKYTFKQFKAEYPDDDTCLDKIMQTKYGGTDIECPNCKRDTSFSKMTKRRGYACKHCGHHIFPCVGTIFEKSRTPLTDWFFAMYLMTSTRHGVAAKELERQIGCTYKTAWRMAHEIRKLMAAADYHGPLSGIVEADEAYLGGRQRGSGKGFRIDKKTALFGMVERDGHVRAGPIKRVASATIHPFVFTNIQRGSTLFTDDSKIYKDIKVRGPYDHHSVNHSRKEYVRGHIHTNTIEGYWSRLKNSIKGTHVHVSSKHAWKYVSEFSFRYNMRKEPGAMFNRLTLAFSLPRLADD